MKNRFQLIRTLLRKRHDPAQILVRLGLRRALAGCESILDVGCGACCSTFRDMGVSRLAGIEAYEPAFREAERRRTHDELVLGDACELDRWFEPRQFDACVAVDVIEHLSKEDGLRLMGQMERVARRRVVFFTPCGFLPQLHRVPGDRQAHLSGWEPQEMLAHGYRVQGFLGPKFLRGPQHRLIQPALAWGLVSLCAHLLWTRRHPAASAAILCVKDFTGLPSPQPQSAAAKPPCEYAAACEPAPRI